MSATEQVKLQEITIGNSDFKDVIDSEEKSIFCPTTSTW